jgi:crotonobetainyl-CoA:carnitine CoA-transferase CaiB-like acyl-CoA transferase
MFGVIGVLAALRHRDRTGLGQLVDVAMLDSMISLCDIVTNYWSMGMRREPDTELRVPYLLTSFRAKDGWCVLQVSRDHQFHRLARLLGNEGWLTDDRFVTRWGWYDHWEETIRPAIESWALTRSMIEASGALAEAGITSAPCNGAEQVVADPHIAARRMLVEVPRTDGVEEPVLIAGNPVKMSRVPEEPEARHPHLGEHTEDLLREVLGLDAEVIAELTRDGVICSSQR